MRGAIVIMVLSVFGIVDMLRLMCCAVLLCVVRVAVDRCAMMCY